MKLHTGNGGIEGCAMAVGSGESWWHEMLCPEARAGLERLMRERAADPEAYLRKYPEWGGRYSFCKDGGA